MGSKSFLAVGSALLVSVLLLASAPPPAVAGAPPHTVGPYKVKDLRVVSGPSPFAGGCPGARFDDMTITGHELEPAIAVNPANPRNIVAAWKQDREPLDERRARLANPGDGGCAASGQ
jgi:hypothetical protein